MQCLWAEFIIYNHCNGGGYLIYDYKPKHDISSWWLHFLSNLFTWLSWSHPWNIIFWTLEQASWSHPELRLLYSLRHFKIPTYLLLRYLPLWLLIMFDCVMNLKSVVSSLSLNRTWTSFLWGKFSLSDSQKRKKIFCLILILQTMQEIIEQSENHSILETPVVQTILNKI